MKPITVLIFLAAGIISIPGCESISYKKTPTGMVYKLIPGGSKDSMAQVGNVVKFNYVTKLNDSVVYDSYGKVPGYVQLTADAALNYSPIEALFFVRKGDSVVTISMVDTLLNKGLATQLPPGVKKGDRMITTMRILEVFTHDSVARPDYEAEIEKDKPRREAEMKDLQAKAEEERKVQTEKGKEEVEAYLKKNNITAQKTEEGTYVVIDNKGAGEPVTNGKFVTIKYAGRLMETGKDFEANNYTFQMGTGSVIRGWDDGLLLFNKGGKGTLYIPGFMAYGQSPGPGGKTWEPLIFDVEVLSIANTRAEADSLSKLPGN